MMSSYGPFPMPIVKRLYDNPAQVWSREITTAAKRFRDFESALTQVSSARRFSVNDKDNPLVQQYPPHIYEYEPSVYYCFAQQSISYKLNYTGSTNINFLI